MCEEVLENLTDGCSKWLISSDPLFGADTRFFRLLGGLLFHAVAILLLHTVAALLLHAVAVPLRQLVLRIAPDEPREQYDQKVACNNSYHHLSDLTLIIIGLHKITVSVFIKKITSFQIIHEIR